MKFTSLLLSLGLMGMVYSRPRVCDPGCKLAPNNSYQEFRHVSKLAHSSVAPWNIITNSEADREPEHILYADCKDCTLENMVAKPIFLEIYVYRKLDNERSCQCPFNLAVGCTCVRKQ